MALCAVGASAQGWMSRPRRLRSARRNRRLTFSPYGPTPIRPPYTMDEGADENVGWRGAAIKYGPQAINAVRTWGPAVKHCVGAICGFDESEDVGGGRIYGEYNKGPVKVGGEWDFDEEADDANVGYNYNNYNNYNYQQKPYSGGNDWRQAGQWRL